jgi:hypothetical protein
MRATREAYTFRVRAHADPRGWAQLACAGVLR